MLLQKKIDTWIFDLDNTLYSADSGIFQQVGKLMGKFIAKHLKINTKKAETKTLNSTAEYASVDDLTCKSGYIKIGNFCRENIENGYWTYDGSTMKCYTGYSKVGTSCKLG